MSASQKPNEESHLSQQRANRLCRAASAAYYSIARIHACRTGEPALIPTHLSPLGPMPQMCEFSRQEIEEAERFLLRLGVIRDRLSAQD